MEAEAGSRFVHTLNFEIHGSREIKKNKKEEKEESRYMILDIGGKLIIQIYPPYIIQLKYTIEQDSGFPRPYLFLVTKLLIIFKNQNTLLSLSVIFLANKGLGSYLKGRIYELLGAKEESASPASIVTASNAYKPPHMHVCINVGL